MPLPPTRHGGVFILALLVIAIGGSFTLYAVRAPQLDGGGVFAPISREGGLLINNLLLTTAAATVLLGTLYPLITEVLTGARISVGPPYFNGVFFPLAVPLVALMGVGPLLAWKRGDLMAALSRLKISAAAILAAAALTLIIAGVSVSNLGGALGLGMAAWLATSTLLEWSERVKIITLRGLAPYCELAARRPRHDVGSLRHGAVDRRRNRLVRMEARAHPDHGAWGVH